MDGEEAGGEKGGSLGRGRARLGGITSLWHLWVGLGHQFRSNSHRMNRRRWGSSPSLVWPSHSGPVCRPWLEPHLPRSPATRRGREPQGVQGLQAWHLCSAWAKPMTLDNKVTTNTTAIGNIMTLGNWLPWIFSCGDLLTSSFPWETLFFFNPFILVNSWRREKLPRSYKEISYTSPFSFLSSWYMYEN